MNKQPLTTARQRADDLVAYLRAAHSVACETDQFAEILLFDLIQPACDIRDRLKRLEMACPPSDA